MLSAMTLDQIGAKMRCDNVVNGPSDTILQSRAMRPGSLEALDALVPPLRRSYPAAEGQSSRNAERRSGVHPGAAQVETAKPGMASRR